MPESNLAFSAVARTHWMVFSWTTSTICNLALPSHENMACNINFIVSVQHEQRRSGNSTLKCYLLTLRNCISTWLVFKRVLVCFILFSDLSENIFLLFILCKYFLQKQLLFVAAPTAVAVNEMQTKSVCFLVSATKSKDAQKCFYSNCHVQSFFFSFFWLEVLLPFSLFCLSEKTTGVKVSNGGTGLTSWKNNYFFANVTKGNFQTQYYCRKIKTWKPENIWVA